MVELVLDGPGKNALSTPLLHGLLEQMDAAAGEPLLLRGNNGAVSAGVDLKEILAADAAAIGAYLSLLDEVCKRLFEWERPTVALVDGHAIAGGAVLAMACDLRVAEANPKLKIGLTEVAVGVRFPPAVWAMVLRRVPLHAQEAVILGAGLFAPEDAQRMGLVDQVTQDAGVVARSWLARMADYDPGVYARTKADLRGGVMEQSAEEVEAYLAEVVPIWTGEALRTRLTGFLKK